MNNMETWKDIVGYEEYYQVSNLGRVRSKDRLVKSKNNSTRTVKGKIKKPSSTDRYYVMLLSKNGVEKGFLVHRLVATHFIENPDNKPEVNHKDGNRQNNAHINLVWSTSSENQIHAYENGLQKPKNGEMSHFAKLTNSDAQLIREEHSAGFSVTYLAIKYNVSPQSVVRILNYQTFKNED